MSNIVDFNAFKRKKDVQDELTRGDRKPLYVSHNTGKVSGKLAVEAGPDFADRLTRIRTSLDKINRLMSDLKSMSVERSND